jgi:hypothetical protein
VSSQSQIANVEVGLSPVNAKIVTWVMGYQYSVPEVQKALAADNWDVIRAKHEALVTTFQLGLQEVAFLGLQQDLDAVPGLLTNQQVTINTAVITGYISDMSADDFQSFVSALLGAYFSNSNSTRLPDTFAIPMQDYLGLGAAASATFPNISKLQYLEDTLKRMTKNPNFKLEGLAYCDQANNAGFVAANWARTGTSSTGAIRRRSRWTCPWT